MIAVIILTLLLTYLVDPWPRRPSVLVMALNSSPLEVGHVGQFKEQVLHVVIIVIIAVAIITVTVTVVGFVVIRVIRNKHTIL